MRHDMTLIRDEFNDILNKLHSKLFDEFLANPICDTYYAWSRMFEPAEFHGIEIHSGCTRAVIVAPIVITSSRYNLIGDPKTMTMMIMR